MSKALVFSINSSKIVHETIDGEVVIIHLETGVYYSLSDTATCIWDMLQAGASFETILKNLNLFYDGTPAEMEKTVTSFLQELQKEGLVKTETSDVSNQNLAGKIPEKKEAFQAPVFEKYSDMQEFLLVDPIHEVNEAGWPHKKEKSSPAK